jgi:hypothetical protein
MALDGLRLGYGLELYVGVEAPVPAQIDDDARSQKLWRWFVSHSLSNTGDSCSGTWFGEAKSSHPSIVSTEGIIILFFPA